MLLKYTPAKGIALAESDGLHAGTLEPKRHAADAAEQIEHLNV
jgi:hypothetical protein